MNASSKYCRYAVVLSAAMLVLSCAAIDSGVTAKVKAKLAIDETVKAYQIDVTTQDKVVTLSGNVSTEEERERALQIARETEGVVDVHNQIMVRTSDESGDAPDTDRSVGQVIADAGITASVKANLLEDPTVRGLRIDVDTREGVVYLTGIVRTDTEKDRAIEIARNTNDVRDVQADLRIEQG